MILLILLNSSDSDISAWDISSVLLDPSCSGSGIVRSIERVHERQSNQMKDNTNNERIEKLSSFQKVALNKALSFPSVQLVVYSTCSIHVVSFSTAEFYFLFIIIFNIKLNINSISISIYRKKMKML